MSIFSENCLLEYQKSVSEFIENCEKLKSLSVKEWLEGYEIYYIGQYIEYANRIELLQTLLDVPTYTCSKIEADYYSALYDYLKNNQKYARIKEKSALNYSTR